MRSAYSLVEAVRALISASPLPANLSVEPNFWVASEAARAWVVTSARPRPRPTAEAAPRALAAMEPRPLRAPPRPAVILRPAGAVSTSPSCFSTWEVMPRPEMATWSQAVPME